MVAAKSTSNSKNKNYVKNGGSSGLWFLGFVGTLVYFIHFHSGSLGLVLLAIIKAIFWPAFLVYYLLQFMHI